MPGMNRSRTYSNPTKYEDAKFLALILNLPPNYFKAEITYKFNHFSKCGNVQSQKLRQIDKKVEVLLYVHTFLIEQELLAHSRLENHFTLQRTLHQKSRT